MVNSAASRDSRWKTNSVKRERCIIKLRDVSLNNFQKKLCFKNMCAHTRTACVPMSAPGMKIYTVLSQPANTNSVCGQNYFKKYNYTRARTGPQASLFSRTFVVTESCHSHRREIRANERHKSHFPVFSHPFSTDSTRSYVLKYL